MPFVLPERNGPAASAELLVGFTFHSLSEERRSSLEAEGQDFVATVVAL